MDRYLVERSALGIALAAATLVAIYVVVSVVFEFTGPRTHTGALVAWSFFGVGISLASRLLPAAAAIAAGSVLAIVGLLGVAGIGLPVADTVEIARVAGSEFTWIAAAVLLAGGLWEVVVKSRASSP